MHIIQISKLLSYNITLTLCPKCMFYIFLHLHIMLSIFYILLHLHIMPRNCEMLY